MKMSAQFLALPLLIMALSGCASCPCPKSAPEMVTPPATVQAVVAPVAAPVTPAPVVAAPAAVAAPAEEVIPAKVRRYIK